MTPPHSSSPPHLAAAAAAVVIATATAAFITALICSRHRKETDARIAKLEETRKAERTGRIRAEMKLRTYLKNQEASSLESSRGFETAGEGGDSDDAAGAKQNNGTQKKHGTQQQQQQHNLLLNCIGTIVSPYTKRMGTPRQGAIVPSGRGYIELKIPVECIEGLECYSHAWIVFTFHANTDTPGVTKKKTTTNKNGSSTMLNLSKTKIRPPRGNGIKVGMLSTRSPHRPNNIGLSLVKIVRVDKKLKQLHIAALDLVSGTPVYDIKPCVPWDVPGYHDKVPLTVPTWVSNDDELKSVKFKTRARESLEECIGRGKLAPLYTCKNDGIEDATNTIREILAQDPRASNSNGPNKRGSTTHNNDVYKIVLCSVEVEFRVGSDGVSVENVCDLDLKGVERVDGIPILWD
ncbi:hypothetical protein ACHAXR_010842 [Thalassiosira sp. AJA248-18]